MKKGRKEQKGRTVKQGRGGFTLRIRNLNKELGEDFGGGSFTPVSVSGKLCYVWERYLYW